VTGGVRWRRWRRAAQLVSASVFVALPLANAWGHRGAVGSLAALRAGPLDLVEPAAGATALLAGGAARWGAIVLGAAPFVLLALALGSAFCGWLCPFGLLSEGIDAVRRRPTWRPGAQDRARRVRWTVLAAVLAGSALAALPLGALLQGPRALTVAALEAIYLGAVSPFAASVLGALLVLDVLLPRRLFCRALCPAGALASLLRTPRTLRIAVDPERCLCRGTPHCLAACPWGIDPRTAGRLDGCTSCLACVEACPSQALRATFAPLPDRMPSSPSPPRTG
jgi:ferredoxin-type protein NapH